MPTYSDEDFERIVATIGVDAALVKRHAERFEEAAQWNRP